MANPKLLGEKAKKIRIKMNKLEIRIKNIISSKILTWLT